jgi:hypothetical protein
MDGEEGGEGEVRSITSGSFLGVLHSSFGMVVTPAHS